MNTILIFTGVIFIILGLLLKDLKNLFMSNPKKMKAEYQRYQNKFKKTSFPGRKTNGTKLTLNENGRVIITAESRLILDEYR